MPRTNPSDVAELLNLDEPDDDLSQFITAANVLVTQKCAGKTNPDGSAYYTAGHLEVIEQWLAAHFYKIKHPDNLINKVSADAESKIESKVDLGLNVTRYGQQALLLDTAGGLSEANAGTTSKRRWNVKWLGRRAEDMGARADS